MTKQEFEKQYAHWVGTSEDDPDLRQKLFDAGLVAMTCDCGEACCHGWQMHMGPPDMSKLMEKLAPAFEQLGYQMAMDREKRVIEAIIGKPIL